MSEGTKNEAAGKMHEVKGAVKAKVGEVLKDPKMMTEGQDEQVDGTIQKKVGQVQKVVGQ